METLYPQNWPQFYTATIEGWKHLLKTDEYKSAVIASLKYLKSQGRIKINAFVIMDNHIHFIWQAMHGHDLKEIQTSFKKFTSQQFLKLLKKENRLVAYEVNSADRKHHFWKRNSLGTELFTREVLLQKLNYIHQNPVSAGLCVYPQEYKYSSAMFYYTGVDEFDLLEHYEG
jgi:putative transposase